MNRRKLLTMTMAAALTTAIAAVSGLADHPTRRYSEREIYELARRNGYEYGLKEGRYDRRGNHRFDYKRNRAWKDGKYGYRDEYRHDGTYKEGFRDGFVAGYEDGYNGSGYGRRDRRRDDDYDYGRRDRRRDDDYDYGRRDRRRDDDDDYSRRDRRDRPWWDIFRGQYPR
jgi:hypothetical protein